MGRGNVKESRPESLQYVAGHAARGAVNPIGGVGLPKDPECRTSPTNGATPCAMAEVEKATGEHEALLDGVQTRKIKAH